MSKALSNARFLIPSLSNSVLVLVGLIGANGAGKTTLLKMLSGLIPPTSGKLSVLGVEPFRRPIEWREQISLVMGQKAQLWWDLPAQDAFDLIRAIYQIDRKTYKTRLSELTELLDVSRLLGTQIRRLSLGERMKMELIGALIHWPKVIFLDEPTIGLDVVASAKLREFLKGFNEREKATIILTSHNMDDIERLCSRVLILQKGSVIYDGSPEGLTEKDSRTLRFKIPAGVSKNHFTQCISETGIVGLNDRIFFDAPDESETSSDYYEVRVSVKQAELVRVFEKVIGKVPLIDLGLEEPSLDSVIQRLFK